MELCPVASSADIPAYMRTSFLTPTYPRWNRCTTLKCHHYCSTQPEASKWWFTWKHLGNENASMSQSQLTLGHYVWEIYRWTLHRKWAETSGREGSLAERWVSGCLPFPRGPLSSALPAMSSHSDLLQPKAICPPAQLRYNAAQENKLERATLTRTLHLTGQLALSLLFKVSDRFIFPAWTWLTTQIHLQTTPSASAHQCALMGQHKTSPITTFVRVGEQLCVHFPAFLPVFHKNRIEK